MDPGGFDCLCNIRDGATQNLSSEPHTPNHWPWLKPCRLSLTFGGRRLTLRVQVPNGHILSQNLCYNYYYPKPKYLICGYLDPKADEKPEALNPLKGKPILGTEARCPRAGGAGNNLRALARISWLQSRY